MSVSVVDEDGRLLGNKSGGGFVVAAVLGRAADGNPRDVAGSVAFQDRLEFVGAALHIVPTGRDDADPCLTLTALFRHPNANAIPFLSSFFLF